MDKLPVDIENIIYKYKHQLEFKKTLEIIKNIKYHSCEKSSFSYRYDIHNKKITHMYFYHTQKLKNWKSKKFFIYNRCKDCNKYL